MKSVFRGALWTGLAFAAGNTLLLAQLKDNSEKQLSCQNSGGDAVQARHCEVREQTVAAMGPLTVDAGQNGGVSVKGWLRSDILVRSRVEAWGDTAAAAANHATQVTVIAGAGQVRATGPQAVRDGGWSVSYEIFVPQNTDLTLKAVNGGITLSDIRGQIRFGVTNGGVQLKRVAGDVSGQTVNGGIQVELAGAIWDGRQLDVSTKNGGVTLGVPSSYSAHIQAETGNGRIQSDFPSAMAEDRRVHKLDLNLGSGGPLIHMATVNGGLRLRRSDTQ